MDHLALAVRDQERSRLFYENYLGFDAEPPQRYSDGTVMLHNAEGFALALGQTDEPIRLPGFLHFGIGVAEPGEVRAFHARLAEDGVPVVEEWDEADYVSVKFKDPDGYVVEVSWEPG